MGQKVYKPRLVQKTAPYQIISKYYREFIDIYDQKYVKKYGLFRPIIDKTVERYLKCGVLKHGFARIKCPDCKTEYLLPFSCKSRICTSCMTKNMHQFQAFIQENIIKKVPHRHMVFCIPKIFRPGFIRNRKFLNSMSRIVWSVVKDFMQITLKINGVPGSLQVIQTHGNMLNLHPHVHIFVSDGLFVDTGTFYCMPTKFGRAQQVIQKMFEKRICDFVIKNKIAHKDNVARIMKQRHTGFSVYTDTRVNFTKYHPEEEKKMQQILRYLNKSFYSMEKVIYTKGADKVIYKAGFNKSIKRNFNYFTPTDFVAAVTAHIPDYHQKYINYYGAYSSKSRGLGKKKGTSLYKVVGATEEQRVYKKSWAQLIKQIYEVDPLECLRCGAQMYIIAYIKDDNAIERILKHCNLWKENDLPPPCFKQESKITYETYVDDWYPS